MTKNLFGEANGKGWHRDNQRHREAALYGKASKKVKIFSYKHHDGKFEFFDKAENKLGEVKANEVFNVFNKNFKFTKEDVVKTEEVEFNKILKKKEIEPDDYNWLSDRDKLVDLRGNSKKGVYLYAIKGIENYYLILSTQLFNRDDPPEVIGGTILIFKTKKAAINAYKEVVKESEDADADLDDY